MRLGGWLLNGLYGGLLVAALPWLAVRRLRHGKDREGWRQKMLGDVPARTGDRPCVWFHAVSVGEVLLIRPVLEQLSAGRPDLEFVISTTTQTGHAVARDKYPDARIIYYPFDFTWAVRKALQRIRPDVVALVELELWPNFIAAVHEQGTPLVLLNGRVSERSFRGYSRIASLVGGWLRKFSLLTVQTREYGDRLIALGAPEERTVVTGSVKYDGLAHDRNQPKTRELAAAFGIRDGECVFIAGSTQAPEEEAALETWRSLKGEFPNLRLVIVPRHKERFEEVAQLIRRSGEGLVRRSESGSRVPSDQGDRPVLLLDSLGELSACWGLADIAFVGGSLSKRGGQNMLEPAAYGAAVMFGPNTSNFRHAVELLNSRDAARTVHSAAEMTEAVRHWLQHPEERQEQGSRARELVLGQQGATGRITELLGKFLPAAKADSAQA